MTKYYKLVNGSHVAVDIREWGRWFETADRDIAVDKIEGEEITVSTVFLGIDHGFGGLPMFFETMIFGGRHDGYQKRYATIEEAKAGHARAVALATKEAGPQMVSQRKDASHE